MKKKLFISVLMVLLLIILRGLWENNALEVNEITVQSQKLPSSFDGYRIAQISDLHNKEFGENNEELLKRLEDSKPDMIAITGDFIDSYHTNSDVALIFARKAIQIAPCFYVSGNHEVRIDEYNAFKEDLKEIGVYILENETMNIKQDNESICVVGLSDPSLFTDYLFGDSKLVVDNELSHLIKSDQFHLLLSHRPELFEEYVKNNVDLILSGHAHGGQFRIPFIGGLIAPNQGLFPKYDSGVYTSQNTNMIVSRGLGNSLFPLRLNNRPEMILVTLKH